MARIGYCDFEERRRYRFKRSGSTRNKWKSKFTGHREWSTCL